MLTRNLKTIVVCGLVAAVLAPSLAQARGGGGGGTPLPLIRTFDCQQQLNLLENRRTKLFDDIATATRGGKHFREKRLRTRLGGLTLKLRRLKSSCR